MAVTQPKIMVRESLRVRQTLPLALPIIEMTAAQVRLTQMCVKSPRRRKRFQVSASKKAS